MNVLFVVEPTGSHLNYYFESLRTHAAVSNVYVVDATGTMQSTIEEKIGDRLAGFGKDISVIDGIDVPLAVVTLEAHHSPPSVHACLEAGCHVIAEKPSCAKIADFEALAETARKCDRQLMLAFANRATPHIIEIRNIVREHLGRLYGIECHTVADQTRVQRQGDSPHWLFQKEKTGGGHLIWLGIHAVDWIHYVTDSVITEVTSLTSNVGGTNVDVEDAAAVSFRMESGALGTLTSGYYIDKGKHISMNIWGENGWLRMMPDNQYKIVWQVYGEEPQVIDYGDRKVGGAYDPFMNMAFAAVQGEREFPLTTEDSLQAIRAVFAAYESAESGQRVRCG